MLNIFYRERARGVKKVIPARNMPRVTEIDGRIAEAAYGEVKKFLGASGYQFQEAETPASWNQQVLFGREYLHIDTSSAEGYLILDGHGGANYRGKIYIHAPAGRRIPLGMVRNAFREQDVLLEVNHGAAIDDAPGNSCQAYLEVGKKDDAEKVAGVVQSILCPTETLNEASVYAAVKKENWVVERKTIPVPKKEAYVIVPPTVKYGVPDSIERGMGAIGNAITTYNLDIRGVCPISALTSISWLNEYVFPSPQEARSASSLMTPHKVDHALVMTKSKRTVYPYFFGDTSSRNGVIGSAIEAEDSMKGVYDEATIKEVRDAIMLGVLNNDLRGAEVLAYMLAKGTLPESVVKKPAPGA